MCGSLHVLGKPIGALLLCCTTAVLWAACCGLGADCSAVIYLHTPASCTKWAQPSATPPCIHPPARAHTPPAPQHHHGVKRKESETIQVQHETQGANKKPRVVWSVEMHQQVGGATAHSFGQHVGRSLVHAKQACWGGLKSTQPFRLGCLLACSTGAAVLVRWVVPCATPAPQSVLNCSPSVLPQFVDAVNQLGVDKAVPKRILDLMNVAGLTRENVASHLQVRPAAAAVLRGTSWRCAAWAAGGCTGGFAWPLSAWRQAWPSLTGVCYAAAAHPVLLARLPTLFCPPAEVPPVPQARPGPAERQGQQGPQSSS